MGREEITEVQRLVKKITSDPSSRAFVQLADKYIEQNRLEEAIEVLATGITYHPTYVAARMMLGKVYFQADRIKEAKAEFEQVVEIHPENILAYKKLAAIYRALNKLGEAVKICNKILAIDPYDKETKNLLASVHDEISVKDDIAALSPSQAPALESEQSPPFQEVFSEASKVSDQTGEIAIGFSKEHAVLLEEPFCSVKESQRVEQAILAGYHQEYHQEPPSPPLNLIRLKAWLGSIQEKGGKK